MKTRILTIAVAAFAATALVGPTSAFAGASHLLGSYKVEKHIDIDGEDGTYTVKCNGNDIAIDGMWRIDNVDQDNDYVYDTAPTGNPAWDVLNSVEPVSAYPTSATTFTFEFLPLSGGDVQGKLFLTCLPKHVVVNNGHTHQWLITGNTINSDDTPSVAAPSSPNTYTNWTHTQDTPCSNGEIAIAPGFRWFGGAYGKPYKRFPTPSTSQRSWDWGFFTATGGHVKTYWECLQLLTDYNQPATPHHRHRLVYTFRNATTPANAPLPGNAVTEVQVICGEHYKAMLGAWDLGYSSYVWDNGPLLGPPNGDYYKKLWYLGMDPRPKTRAFKILNTGPASVASGTKFGSLCFKDSTT
ncbi:MAG: hypothetical protein JWM71_1012 [Solirubrobacteraceae bacterium]|nr:hypothetical protein [Solirubrobacteraceae bacterium]